MISVRDEWERLTKTGGSRMNKNNLRRTFEWILLEMGDEYYLSGEIRANAPDYVRNNCTSTEMGAILKLICLKCPNVLERRIVSGGRRRTDGSLMFLDDEEYGTYAYRKTPLQTDTDGNLSI